MLRKWSVLVLLLVATPFLALGQSTGKLTGMVVDAETGEPLPTANIILVGTQLGTATDFDGAYTIIGVPVGSYDVRASFVGYQPVLVSDVEITAGYTRELNFELAAGQQLETIVVEYERPLIQDDAIGVPNVVTSEQIANLPVRGAANLAGLQAGVVKEATSGNLYIRGGREQDVAYYVNGVKVLGNISVPTHAIEQQEMLIGSIPARYGDVMSGVVSITTKTGQPEFFGSIEGITSEVLDPYGYNTANFTLGGPIFSEDLTFFVAGDYDYRADAGPRAIGFATLNDDVLARIQRNPQVLEIFNAETGDTDYIPLPTVGNPGEPASAADVLAAADVPEGYEIVSPEPISAGLVVLEDDILRESAKDDPFQSMSLSGNAQLTPFPSVRFRVGGAWSQNEGRLFSRLGYLYAPESYRISESDYWRGFATWTQYLSNNVFYQLQVEYSNDFDVFYPQAFSSDVRDALNYGDISNPANAIAARYQNFTVNDNGDSVYVQVYGDGFLPTGGVHSQWALPGAPQSRFTKSDDSRFGVSASATAQLGAHQLDFGGEYEQQTRRYFTIGGADVLARYETDGNVEGGDQFAVDSYEELSYDVVDNNVFYYGYNYLGTEEVNDQSFEGIYADPESDAFNANMAPYQPIYYAGFVSDKIEYNDVVLQLGVRVDVFDNNTLVLKDPFALIPIVRAGDIGSAPGQVESDYAVYFDGRGNPVGYRDKEGNFYNAQGQDVAVREVTGAGSERPCVTSGGNVNCAPNATGETITRLVPEVFTDYEPQVTVQPRIGVSFPVTNRALFFASYDVQTQRPQQNRYDTIQQFAQALEVSKRLNNPALEPERSVNYQLGFRQRLGERSAFTLTGFYRQIDNLISRRIFPTVYPNNYQSYRNIDFGTVKGVELEYELRRTNNLALNAHYTFSLAEGTGSDPQTTATIVWRQEVDPFYPRFIAPLAFDRRHSLAVTLDYRLGEEEGPEIMGGHPFANFGVNLIGTFKSGLPYTAWEGVNPIWQAGNSQPVGEIFDQRLPATTLLNLRVDRNFELGGANLNAFLWVQNLLNTDNVEHVYNFTGSAESDGFLAQPLGAAKVASIREGRGDRVASSFADHYRANVRNPYLYSLPRQTRLGLRLTF